MDTNLLSEDEREVLAEAKLPGGYTLEPKDVLLLVERLAAERKKNAKLVKALQDAATSLRYISSRKLENDDTQRETASDWMYEIRGYSNSRAETAEAELAKLREGK